MGKLNPNPSLLQTLLRDASNKEIADYTKLFDELDDEGKSDLLEQMCFKGFRDYRVQMEDGFLFFSFLGNIYYRVHKTKYFGDEALCIMGPVGIRGSNHLVAPRLWAIYVHLEKKIGYTKSDYHIAGDANQIIIYFTNDLIKIPPL